MFQSTPPREGRHKAFEAYTKFIKFQSTPPREGRRKKRPIYKARLGFNPRPHTRGDYYKFDAGYFNDTFQSTPPHEGRPKLGWEPPCDLLFQSTPPRGGDVALYIPLCCSYCFNPRPRAGATYAKIEIRKINCVSIHAPARGRPVKNTLYNCTAEFQSTPPRGGDYVCMFFPVASHGFNPRPRAGATAYSESSWILMF